MSAKPDANFSKAVLARFSLTEDDAFFLMRFLPHLETDAERRRLVDIVEQIVRFSDADG